MKPGLVRLRLFGGQTVPAIVHRRFLFLRLCEWAVRESWDGTPPFTDYHKIKWRPSWRIVGDRHERPQARERMSIKAHKDGQLVEKADGP